MLGRPVFNHNPIEAHTRVKIDQREYLRMLSAVRHLNPTGTVDELFSRGLVHFLANRPHLEDGWQWHKPESHYIKVAGERQPNPGWVVVQYKIVDVAFEGSVVPSAKIHGMLKEIVNSAKNPPGAMSVLLHSSIWWICEKLYPPKIYDVRQRPIPQLPPGALEMIQKHQIPG